MRRLNIINSVSALFCSVVRKDGKHFSEVKMIMIKDDEINNFFLRIL